MTVTTTDPLVEADTSARLRAIVGKLSRRLSATAKGAGLTQSQLSVLGVIARQGPIKLTDLAEAESLNPTMLSRVVAALEEQGLIRRRSDAHDKRITRVETTAAGRRTHEKLREQRGRILADALAELTPEQRAAIEAALPALEALVTATKPTPASRR